MKDLKAFLEDLSTNESLAKKFEGIKEADKIVALAKEEGYEFTKKEYDNAMLEMVSGGAGLDWLNKGVAFVDNLTGGAASATINGAMQGYQQSQAQKQQSGLAWKDGGDGYEYAADLQSGTQLARHKSSGERYVMSTNGWVQY